MYPFPFSSSLSPIEQMNTSTFDNTELSLDSFSMYGSLSTPPGWSLNNYLEINMGAILMIG